MPCVLQILGRSRCGGNVARPRTRGSSSAGPAACQARGDRPVLASASLEDRACTPLPRSVHASWGQVHLASRRHPGRDGRGPDADRQLLVRRRLRLDARLPARRSASRSSGTATEVDDRGRGLEAWRRARRRRSTPRTPAPRSACSRGARGPALPLGADRRRVAAAAAGRARRRAAARHGRDRADDATGGPRCTIEGGRAARDRVRAARRERAGEDGRAARRAAGRGRDHRRASRAPAATTPSACCPLFGVTVRREGLRATVDGGARLAGTRRERPRRRLERGLPGGRRAGPARLRGAARRRAAHPRRAPPSSTCCARWAAAVETRLEAQRARAGRLDRRSSSRLHGTARRPGAGAVADRRGAGARRRRRLRRGHASRVTGAGSCGSRRATGSPRSPRGWPPSGRACASCPTGSSIDGGRPLRGARVRSHGDHRIAMALSVAALARARRDRGRGRRLRRRLVPRVLRAPRAGRRRCLSRPARVVLVGLHGRGKSTVGRLVARPPRLPISRTSTSAIEERAGRSIAAIFQERGEAAFRALEREEAQAAASPDACAASSPPAAARSRLRRPARCCSEGRCTVWLRCDLDTVCSPRPGRRHPAARRRTVT